LAFLFFEALEGRNNSGPHRFIPPFQGFILLYTSFPGASPRAYILRPFGAYRTEQLIWEVAYNDL
jgi:hypothetical protein